MTGQRPHTLVLAGEGGIKAATEVVASLRQALEAHDHIAVDSHDLTGADLTTAQALLAARASAKAQSKTLQLLAPLSVPLADALARLGLLSPDQESSSFWVPSPDHA